jgi:Sec-independent protein translocase protein TatA
VGFGTDVLFILALGFLFVGPKRLPAILGHIARAKAQLESASQNLKLQLETELEKQRDPERVNSAGKTGAEQ